jgi:hypothetical protein
MPGFFKFLKGYTSEENAMSKYLSASCLEPSEDELKSIFKLYTSTYGRFIDLHRMILQHLFSLDNINKYLRAIYLLSYVLKALAPYANQGQCTTFDELDLDDSSPIPPASLFLHIRLSLIDAKGVLEGVQWWGEKIELNMLKKKKDVESLKPKLPSTEIINKKNGIIVYDYDDVEQGSSVTRDGNSFEHSLITNQQSDVLRRSDGGVNNASNGSDTQNEISISYGSNSGSHNGENSNNNNNNKNNNNILNIDTSLIITGSNDKTIDQIITPPSGFIVNLHELWTKHNISAQTTTQNFLNLIDSYSLIKSNVENHNIQELSNNFSNISLQQPIGPPPRINQKISTPSLPSGPPPKLNHFPPSDSSLNHTSPSSDIEINLTSYQPVLIDESNQCDVNSRHIAEHSELVVVQRR